ncbi:hypothetical protein [Roseomonas rosulenta]|uniref:hypothetical protein n=1 Tax=Roseomonas rosulenta TaxID=2748667 RepID=UPI0018DFD441|nr:hypothetical protein [Roseomonas rosulenta]
MLAVLLGAVAGAEVAGRVICGLAVVLPPLGAAMLNRSLFGGWHWWMAGMPVLAWNGSLLMGLVTFQIGAGLALLIAAFDHDVLRRRPRALRFVARAGATGLLLFVHPFAAAFLALLLGGLAVGRRLGGPGRALRRMPGLLVTGAACILPVVLYLALTPVPPMQDMPDESIRVPDRGGIAQRLSFAFGILVGAQTTYDINTEWLWLVPLWIAVVAAMLLGRGMRGHHGILLVAGGLALLGATMPAYVVGNAMSNWRVAALVGLTLVAGCRPAVPFPVRPGAGAAFAAALFAVGALRTAWVGAVWWPARADVVAVQRVIAQVPSGAIMLMAEHSPDLRGDPPSPRHRVFIGGWQLYWHLGTLAVTWRDAFVPTLFTGRGKQPLRPRFPWDALAVPDGWAFSLHLLALPPEVLRERLAADPYLAGARYLADWRNSFEFLLVLNADQPDREGPIPRIPGIELVADEGFAQLWRIVPSRRDRQGSAEPSQ